MKKISAIVLFFSCNAGLIFFEVHKQSKYLKLSYQTQKLQAQICQLDKQKTELTYELYQLQQPDKIQDIAIKNLGMKNIELKKIKKVVKDDDETNQYT